MLRHGYHAAVVYLCALIIYIPLNVWALQFNYLSNRQNIVDAGGIATQLYYNGLSQGSGQRSREVLGNQTIQAKSIYTPVTLTVSGHSVTDDCPAGKICAQQLGNGNVMLYDYRYDSKTNPYQQINQVVTYQPTDASHTNYVLSYKVTYQYNLNGELSQKTYLATNQPNQTVVHVYDTLGRLVSSVIANQTTSYQYDANNNRLKVISAAPVTEQVNGIDQLTQHNTARLMYGGNGNMLNDGANGQYDFNARNQLVGFANVTDHYQYQYTANGIRWQKTLLNTPNSLVYYYDGTQLLNSALLENHVVSSMSHYLLSGAHIGQVITHINHISTDANSAAYFLLGSKHSIIGNLDDTGKLVSMRHYTDYGIPTGNEKMKKLASLSLQGIPFGYDGEQYDPETKLSYLRARYYNPTLGRFISQDGYGLMNRYIFAQGDPVNRIDPNGHMSFWKTFNLVLAVGSVAMLFGGAGFSLTAYALGWFETGEMAGTAILSGETASEDGITNTLTGSVSSQGKIPVIDYLSGEVRESDTLDGLAKRNLNGLENSVIQQVQQGDITNQDDIDLEKFKQLCLNKVNSAEMPDMSDDAELMRIFKTNENASPEARQLDLQNNKELLKGFDKQEQETVMRGNASKNIRHSFNNPNNQMRLREALNYFKTRHLPLDLVGQLHDTPAIVVNTWNFYSEPVAVY